ncbi:hypothetical protein ACH4KU_07200 [Streptomyces althioticus]|uniref:hypothetical protein n=1 Tax=Streptomyces TaxID=1883 RepID=UPI0036BE16A3
MSEPTSAPALRALNSLETSAPLLRAWADRGEATAQLRMDRAELVSRYGALLQEVLTPPVP